MPLEDTMVVEINDAIEANAGKPSVSEATPFGEATPAVVEEKVAEPVEEKIESVNEPIPSSETASATIPDTEKLKLSEAAIMRAVRAGLTLSDANSFTNDESLNRVSASIETARRPVEKHEVEETVVEEDPFENLPKLDPEIYEADVIKMYDGLVGVLKKQQETIKDLRSNQNHALEANQRSVASDTEKWFDAKVAELGEEFHEVLGKGSYKTLDQSGSQYAKRDAIANQTAILLAGYRASGLAVPPRDEVFSQAARLVLGSEFEKVHEKRLADKLASRSTQHIARSGAKNGKSKGDPLADVAAMIDAKFFGKQ